MWWLITLLVLAVLAFFIVKTMMAQTQRQQAEHLEQQEERLAQSASLEQQDTGAAIGAVDSSGASASEASDSTLNSSSGIAAASVVAVAGAALSQTSSAPHNATQQNPAPIGTALQSESSNAASIEALNTGNTLSDVREMVKILNLDGPDATRLDINAEQLIAIRKGESEAQPDEQTLLKLASRLRGMLA